MKETEGTISRGKRVSKDKLDKRSLYFKTIARDFFERRGAPFFLSAKDLSQIEQWEKAGIPLRVAREGIARAFSLRQKKGSPKGKIFSLTFCERNVQDAFSLYKERSVGKKQREGKTPDKKTAVEKAVGRFANNIPSQILWLEKPFREVMAMLPDCSEDDLERLEEEVETLIFLRAGEEEREEARREVESEFPEIGPRESRELARIKLIKIVREKHKIPHIAPFYY